MPINKIEPQRPVQLPNISGGGGADTRINFGGLENLGSDISNIAQAKASIGMEGKRQQFLREMQDAQINDAATKNMEFAKQQQQFTKDNMERLEKLRADNEKVSYSRSIKTQRAEQIRRSMADVLANERWTHLVGLVAGQPDAKLKLQTVMEQAKKANERDMSERDKMAYVDSMAYLQSINAGSRTQLTDSQLAANTHTILKYIDPKYNAGKYTVSQPESGGSSPMSRAPLAPDSPFTRGEQAGKDFKQGVGNAVSGAIEATGKAAAATGGFLSGLLPDESESHDSRSFVPEPSNEEMDANKPYWDQRKIDLGLATEASPVIGGGGPPVVTRPSDTESRRAAIGNMLRMMPGSSNDTLRRAAEAAVMTGGDDSSAAALNALGGKGVRLLENRARLFAMAKRVNALKNPKTLEAAKAQLASMAKEGAYSPDEFKAMMSIIEHDPGYLDGEAGDQLRRADLYQADVAGDLATRLAGITTPDDIRSSLVEDLGVDYSANQATMSALSAAEKGSDAYRQQVFDPIFVSATKMAKMMHSGWLANSAMGMDDYVDDMKEEMTRIYTNPQTSAMATGLFLDMAQDTLTLIDHADAAWDKPGELKAMLESRGFTREHIQSLRRNLPKYTNGTPFEDAGNKVLEAAALRSQVPDSEYEGSIIDKKGQPLIPEKTTKLEFDAAQNKWVPRTGLVGRAPETIMSPEDAQTYRLLFSNQYNSNKPEQLGNEAIRVMEALSRGENPEYVPPTPSASVPTRSPSLESKSKSIEDSLVPEEPIPAIDTRPPPSSPGPSISEYMMQQQGVNHLAPLDPSELQHDRGLYSSSYYDQIMKKVRGMQSEMMSTMPTTSSQPPQMAQMPAHGKPKGQTSGPQKMGGGMASVKMG